jgi:outer membrane protein OmpA-like peptidoglycan-associated protein
MGQAFRILILVLLLPIGIVGCIESGKKSKNAKTEINTTDSLKTVAGNERAVVKVKIGLKVERAAHHINTDKSEYFPCIMSNGDLIFSAMDRTGYFDYKIDYTQTKTAGGEDIFISKKVNGLFEDARPFGDINTNAHETISQVINDNEWIGTGNYQENIGPQGKDAGVATGDIFTFKKTGQKIAITHWDEPVNSIYGEFDPFIYQSNVLLFASDRPGAQGEYHKKGWRWNESLWGNTDIYVSFEEDGYWTEPKNLGKVLNTPYAERSPMLSKDGLTLYLASNGYDGEKKDLNIYYFTRENINDWDHWKGPFLIEDLYSEQDDWGLRMDQQGTYYFVRSQALRYNSTQVSREGDAYVRETNFRTGYEVLGSPSAALKKDSQMDIMIAFDGQLPSLILDDVLFAFDKATLNANGVKAMDRVIDYLKINGFKNVQIIGNTDNMGNKEYNQELSERRAEAVMNILKASEKLKGLVFETKGNGDNNPRFDNHSSQGRAKNRRVELFAH